MFFFKQKTAYEMRISDWSSDVCSSDLRGLLRHRAPAPAQPGPDADQPFRGEQDEADEDEAEPQHPVAGPDREQLTEQNVEEDAQGRPQDVAHAADYDHGQQLAEIGRAHV